MSGIYPAMPAARIWLLTMGLLLLVAALLLPLTPSKRHFVTGDPVAVWRQSLDRIDSKLLLWLGLGFLTIWAFT